MTKQAYGALPDGTPVALYTLSNSNGMRAGVITYGGIVVSLSAPDRNGKYSDVVLGMDDLPGYLTGAPAAPPDGASPDSAAEAGPGDPGPVLLAPPAPTLAPAGTTTIRDPEGGEAAAATSSPRRRAGRPMPARRGRPGSPG